MTDDKGRQLMDDKVVDYFNTLDSLYCCQQEFQDQLSAGFFNLSKARYTMGVKAVGALQFDERETTPLATINVNSEGDTTDLFVLVREGSEVSSTNEESGKPRKRGQKCTNKDDTEKEDFDDMDWINDQIKKMGIGSLDGLPTEPKSKPVNQDPLKWFGVLVPQTLRVSQKSFQDAIQLAVEMANLRHKLLTIKNSYQELEKARVES
ncbi:coiled-coil domain-containing protein 115-like [Liolophura sinensis]|uniref:coiled-coil domain-containing protein 115-like n=1 Tax=Liolophura sinensis TaxID=3198878 RepID=UPI00315915D1